jgi:hypothetical protein
MRAIVVLVFVLGCASSPRAPSTWPVPAGWKHEVIPFPLDFAPGLPHRGLEELRFPPGFLKAGAPNHWSYAFAWRLDDAAQIEPNALASELAVYFRGLLAAVDGDKHRLDPAQITVTATPQLELRVHLIDTFGDAAAVDLVGTAHRSSCGGGALWTFVLAPETSPIRHQLDDLVASAACGQTPVR